MRVTIRFNEAEELKLKRLQEYLKEDDISKVIKFALDTSLHHIETVTTMLVSPNWDVLFMKKRKSNELRRKVYE